MATNNLTLRIFDTPEFRAYAFKTVITEDTTLLDSHVVDVNGDIVFNGWSSTTIARLLADDEVDECLNAFEVTIPQLWSIASFYELYIRPKKDRDLVALQQAHATGDHPETEGASLPTLKLRRWFGGWWHDHALGIREKDSADLARIVMPAFYIGDPKVFMDITHDWVLHTTGRQSSIAINDESDEGGKGTLAIHHPVLGKLAAVRSNMINKIEDALPYDEENDGLPRERKDRNRGAWTKPRVCQDPDWCPKEKTAAYYTALMATGCWPVGDAMQKRSVYGILSGLREFDYVPYRHVKHLPDRAAARAKMPTKENGKDSKKKPEKATVEDGSKCEDKITKENDRPDAPKKPVALNDRSGKPCNVCVDGAVKASFDRKVKCLFKSLLNEKQTTVRKECEPGRWVLKRMDDSFKGPCLDCLTKTKFESEDDDYWNHCHNFELDYGCTVKRGQPTWYFSYMGRPEALQQWTKKREERARAPIV
ncbi:hypothetical protein VMCG_09987 [Cytospora schulzeri]|uniref:Uncharacterized protein n=1 Tax=Cytospora schulzeri TaxID=448051 RepID=A0A423VIW5_9PEZI|nr:hypothetical protein VMCG_09987 [Valsa malicola]